VDAEPAADEPAKDAPAEEAVSEAPGDAEQAPPAEVVAEEPASEVPAEEAPADQAAAAETPVAEAPAEETPAEDAPAEEAPTPPDGEQVSAEPTADAPASADEPVAEEAGTPVESPPADAVPEPVEVRLAKLSADARYFATGKRKTSVARVIIRPGSGAFDINGRTLDVYFPRRKLQAVVRQPLDASGFLDRLDVRARVHGGGVSSQADAVRHGIAKALIDADPQLRGELKRRQLLTRDPRVKERRKAGLKKARKRPQFSKR
jgi:small subunit ribosomal protein S9